MKALSYSILTCICLKLIVHEDARTNFKGENFVPRLFTVRITTGKPIGSNQDNLLSRILQCYLIFRTIFRCLRNFKKFNGSILIMQMIELDSPSITFMFISTRYLIPLFLFHITASEKSSLLSIFVKW